MKIWEIPTPALILEEPVMQENRKKMAAIVEKAGVALRPHYKSHKSKQLAKMQMADGAKGLAAAKLGEAEDLVEAGISDVLIANEITQPSKIAKVAELAKQSRVTVCVDQIQNVKDLSEAAQQAGSTIYVFVEYNIGQNRCGVDTFEECYTLAKAVTEAEGLVFDGIEAYAGHLAHEYDYDKRYAATMVIEDTLRALKQYLEERAIPVKEISGVSTGTVTFRAQMENMECSGTMYTEVQPGSYLFMDSAYNQVGLSFQSSLFLLASVISTKKDLVVTDAGLKTASVDMGTPVLVGYPEAKSDMSEEHISHVITDHPFHINDLVRYIPSHCCTTVNLHDRIYLVRGEDVLDVIQVDSRGKSY